MLAATLALLCTLCVAAILCMPMQNDAAFVAGDYPRPRAESDAYGDAARRLAQRWPGNRLHCVRQETDMLHARKPKFTPGEERRFKDRRPLEIGQWSR